MSKKIPKQVKLVKESYIKQSRKNIHISYSQLNTYLNCPRLWELQYLRKIAPFDPSIHMTFGSAFHETLQNYLDVMYNDSVKAANDIDIDTYLYDQMIKNYRRTRAQNGHEHYTTADQLNLFYLDGKHILDYIKKNRGTYFQSQRKGVHLAGIETLLYQELSPGIFFKGLIDLVFWDERDDTYTLVDIKTSTKGWNKWAKEDDKKTAQLLLYKEFFSKQFNVDVDKVKIAYFIVKRQVPVEADFASMQKRVQEFIPASGKLKRGKAISYMNKFIEDTLDEDGKFLDKKYKCTNQKPCFFCSKIYNGILD